MATMPGESLHADVTKIREDGFDHSKWLTVTVDECTNFLTADPERLKSGCNMSIQNRLEKTKNETGKPPKRVTVDNGTDVQVHKLGLYCKDEGAELRTSPVYDPAPNGRAERAIRAVIVKIRTFMVQGSIPVELWPEIAKSVAYLHNLTVGVHGIAPIAKWRRALGDKSFKPDLSHLRVLGCQCFVRVPDAQLDKLKKSKIDAKGEEGILVGYQGNHLYRIWVIERKVIMVSSNVHFFEVISDDGLDHYGSWPNGTWRKTKDIRMTSTEDPMDLDIAEEQEVEIRPDMPGPPAGWSGGHSHEMVSLTDLTGETDFLPPAMHSAYYTSFIEIPKVETLPITEHPLPKVCAAQVDPYLAPTVSDALGSEESDQWREAMETELMMMLSRNVFKFVDLPPDRKAVTSRWVLQRKIGPDGKEIKKKARLVARGFMQKQGIDYTETVAHTSKADSWRTLLALAVTKGWVVKQLDVIAAFLYGMLDEDVFLYPAQLFEWFFKKHPDLARQVDYAPGKIVHLQRAIYGLKQGGHQFQMRLRKDMSSVGLTYLHNDPATFKGTDIIAATHVDDMMYAGTKQAVEKFEDDLSKLLDTKLLGAPTWLLGIEIGIGVVQGRTTQVVVTQETYTREALEHLGLAEARTIQTPIDKVVDYHEGEAFQQPLYQHKIGKMSYLAVMARPDEAFATSQHSKVMSNPAEEHHGSLTRSFKYLRGREDWGIAYTKEEAVIEIDEDGDEVLIVDAYSDSSHGNCPTTRRSSFGFIVMIAGGPVSWCARIQKSAVGSSTEAEYIAAYVTTLQCRWLRQFLTELGIKHRINLRVDNQSAISIARNAVSTKRSRHYEIKWHVFREAVLSGEVTLIYVPTQEQLADIMTKPLPAPTFHLLVSKILRGRRKKP